MRQLASFYDVSLHPKDSLKLIFSLVLLLLDIFVAFVVQEVSQPAIFVCSMAAVEKLRLKKGDAVLDEATCAMGLSLGEYSALCFAGAITFEDGVKVTKARSVTDAVTDVKITEVRVTEVRVIEVKVRANDKCYNRGTVLTLLQ